MWKKSEPEVSSQTTAKTPTPARPASAATKKSRIGVGLLLKGELHGEEDIVIEGRLEGKITLKKHGVIIEASGRVDADITASSICVAGEVHGNLHGTEQVVLLKTGRVEGNISAKSVTLETGAQFKGSIDMETMRSASSTQLAEKKSAPDSNDSPTKTSGSTHRFAAS